MVATVAFDTAENESFKFRKKFVVSPLQHRFRELLAADESTLSALAVDNLRSGWAWIDLQIYMYDHVWIYVDLRLPI